jgi:hypothetical protein
MNKPTVEQLTELRARWDRNPASYRGLFREDGCAVPLAKLLRHLEARGMTHVRAIGEIATLTQLGKLQMISTDLVRLGPKAEALPEWIELTTND